MSVRSPGPPTQAALPLEPGGDPGSVNIIIGNANAHVIAALREPERWPFHTAILTGPPRSGKSLLGRWAQLAGIEVIDGADRADETELFHRWNAQQEGATEAGRSLLLIADRQPWQIRLPDLASRLGGSLQLEIGEPDDVMIARLVETHATQRGLALGEGAAAYLAPRLTRSFAAIEQTVRAIDRISLERQMPATMSIWRAALEAVQGPEQQSLL